MVRAVLRLLSTLSDPRKKMPTRVRRARALRRRKSAIADGVTRLASPSDLSVIWFAGRGRDEVNRILKNSDFHRD